jgi:hypothetical protein
MEEDHGGGGAGKRGGARGLSVSGDCWEIRGPGTGICGPGIFVFTFSSPQNHPDNLFA